MAGWKNVQTGHGGILDLLIRAGSLACMLSQPLVERPYLPLCLRPLSSTLLVKVVCGRMMLWQFFREIVTAVCYHSQASRFRPKISRILGKNIEILPANQNSAEEGCREQITPDILNKQCIGSRTHVLEMFFVICFDASLKDRSFARYAFHVQDIPSLILLAHTSWSTRPHAGYIKWFDTSKCLPLTNLNFFRIQDQMNSSKY